MEKDTFFSKMEASMLDNLTADWLVVMELILLTISQLRLEIGLMAS